MIIRCALCNTPLLDLTMRENAGIIIIVGRC